MLIAARRLVLETHSNLLRDGFAGNSPDSQSVLKSSRITQILESHVLRG